jgi:flagellar basal body-associated protein FliL
MNRSLGAGTRLANIGYMPDVSPGSTSAPVNRSRSASSRSLVSGKLTNKKKMGVATLVLGLAAAAGFVWLRPETTTPSSADAGESTLVLETFVVNLDGANLPGASQRAYLRIGVTLGLAHPLPRNRPEAIPTALVRDTILSVLATARPEELLKLEGKRHLKDELLKALRERVPQLAVENVYFTEFLVQM